MIRYAITSPEFFKTLQQKKDYLKRVKADYVLFRDKTASNYKSDALEFLNLSKKYNFKRILHQNFNLAKKLKANGIHLTSKQFKFIKKAKTKGVFVIVSTHSIYEIKKAKYLGADATTFSPIFNTPGKGKSKGLLALKKAQFIKGIKIIALGGIISKKEIKKVSQTKIYGFASIRYFV